MNSRQFQHLESIYQQAIDLPPPQREAFLAEACAGEPGMREEIEALLEHYELAGDGFLEQPVHEFASLSDARRIPRRIGHFEIMRLIGEGGMGTVYEARQEHPSRSVAVKVIRPGIPSAESLRRFENEAEILGRLQHPAIAHIYEAGVAEVVFSDASTLRQPFFAMELVQGRPLNRYLENAALVLEDRLELFARVGDAIEYAHQSGIIHRDLKPSNILVTADRDPKVLDFGVARVTNADVQMTTIHTDLAQVVGTLPYMSPEQVDQAREQIDARSDVYALGVILYEIIAGRLPYDLSGMPITRAARVITEDAPIPLGSLDRRFRGDLNTIVNKVLEKEPQQRYQSVGALVADVRRFLKREPIAAKPTSAAYHVRKFAQRNPALVAAVAATFIVLLAGVIGTTTFAFRERSEARARRDVAQFLHEMLTSIEPAKTAGEPLTVREMLDNAVVHLDDRFEEEPLIRGELHRTVGSTYHKLGLLKEAERHTRSAMTDLQATAGPNADSTLRVMSSLGLILCEMDRLEEAEAILLDAQQRLTRSDSPVADSIREHLAIVFENKGSNQDALHLFRDVYERVRVRNGDRHTDTLRAQSNLGNLLRDLRRYDEARPLLENCLSERRIVLGDDHPDTIVSMTNLAALYFDTERYNEGTALLQEAVERSVRVLGPVHISSLRCRQNLLRFKIFFDHDCEVAIPEAATLLADSESELGPSHGETLAALELMVTAMALGGEPDAAESKAVEWYDRLCAQQGPEDTSSGRIAFLLQNLYEEIGRPDQEDIWRQRVEASSFRPPADQAD